MSEVHHVEANGLRFAYHQAGEGPRLALLVHGFPDTPHTWHGLMPALAEAGYRAVAPFTRGYAPTQRPPTEATTLTELAADALALVEALGHERCVLIGHDWGAATAYLAAATAPARVEKLITVGIPHPAAIKPSLKMLWAARHFLTFRLPGAVAGLRADDSALVDTLYRRWSPTWDFGPEETAAVKECFARPGSAEAAIGYYRGASLGKIEAPLRGKIAAPTLAFAGADDPALDVSVYEEARRKFSGPYRVVALPGGHWVHRESPDAFRENVLDFLS